MTSADSALPAAGTTERPVLVVGGTGHLGRKVVRAVIGRGRGVRALVRPGSDAEPVERLGATVVRGDLLDRPSLERAVDGADAIVTSAAGYTRRRKGDTSATDVVGNRNLAGAASSAGTRRFVLTSILACDSAPEVEHFWHKKLAEDELERQHVPFVALRPGAFLDQPGDPYAAMLRRGVFVSPVNPDAAWSYVLTDDLARWLAAAVDAPGVEGERIDVGLDQPLSARSFAAVAERVQGRRVRVLPLPWKLTGPALSLAGRYQPALSEVRPMFDFFLTGRYVAGTGRQTELFGPAPSADDAFRRWLVAPPGSQPGHDLEQP